MPKIEAQHTGFSDRQTLREVVSSLVDITENHQPSEWWQLLYTQLILLQQQIQQENVIVTSEELQRHLQKSLTTLSRLLTRVKPSQPLSEGDIVNQTEHFIMQFSMKRAKIHEKKVEKETNITNFISIDELVQHPSGRIRKIEKIIEDKNKNPIFIIELQIKHPIDNVWFPIPLPKNENIWHKGGPVRAVMNIVANAPTSMQLAEFPWNDLDVITAGNNQHNYQVSTAINVDPDGIEYMGEKQLNFPRYARGRDTDQNQCCLGSDGLYFTRAAFEAAKTGHISIVGEYIANKAIYGIDSIVIDGVLLIKPRGLMRLMKNLAEGKALSFDYKLVNNNFDCGIYLLFLAKKWSKRNNFGVLLQNLFFLLQQMGQLQPTDKSIIDVLERAHQQYPFFDFDREINTKLDLTRWKSRKLSKQFDREAAMMFGLPSNMKLIRKPNDEMAIQISLYTFSANSSENERINNWWPTFLIESKIRTATNSEKNLSMFQRLFFQDLEDDDTNFDPSLTEVD